MAYADCLMCERLFEYLADAKDTSMLESKHSAVMQSERAFNSILQSEDSFLRIQSSPFFFRLCASAAENSMNVILQDTRSSLLVHRKLVEIVCALCQIITQYIEHQNQPGGNHWGEITAAGLQLALLKFTEAAWQALQQLESDNWQPQQRPKHKHKNGVKHHLQQQCNQMDRCDTAALLIVNMLATWACSCTILDSPYQAALPLLITVVTQAPTLLQQAARATGCSNSSSSSGNSPALLHFEHRVRSIAAMSAQVAFSVVCYLSCSARDDRQPGTVQQILHAEQLPQLLLQLLAHQAGKLHDMCSGMSQALQANRAAALSSHATQQQQQQQPPACCVVPPHHLPLLRLIGWGHAEQFVCNVDVQYAYRITLEAMLEVVHARHTAAQPNSHNTDNARQDTAQQQTQQQPGSTHSVLPSNLLVPAVKLLIEVLLLLPASRLEIYDLTMQLIKMLLTTSFNPPAPPAAAAAVGHDEVQHRAEAPWQQLPAAVAAGLLQPVIALLSQAVIYGLLQTNHHTHQQQQSSHQQMKAESQRLALLHDYGCLLLVICQAVEWKHIATVLQPQSSPDLLIILAATEAVIRAQACHLAPGYLKQQLQQQQQADDAGSNRCPIVVVWDLTHTSLAALWLLPFVSKLVRSLEHLLQFQDLITQHFRSPSPVSKKLSARLCTLLTTAMKVVKCAVASVAPDKQESVSQEAMETAVTISESARYWFSVVQATTNSMPGACTMVQDPNMSVGLMCRALLACSYAMTGWAASYESQLAAAAVGVQDSLPATTVDPLCANKITGVTHFKVLKCLERALGNAEDVLSKLATARAGHTTATSFIQPALSQQQNNCTRSMPHHEQLQLMVQRSKQVRACIMPDQLLYASTTVPIDAVVATTRLEGRVGEEANGGVDVPSTALPEGEAKGDVLCVSRGIDEMCDILQKDIDAGHPSEGMPVSPSHLSALVCDLADAVVPWFPLTICCNNPGCTNLIKLSEWQLVCGKACVCAGCEMARYCSKSCQQRH